MSISTTGSSYINLGSVTSTRTACWWVKIATSVANYQSGFRYSDESGPLGGNGGYETDSNELGSATGVYAFLGEDPPGPGFTSYNLPAGYIGAWVFFAMTWDITGGAGTRHIYYRAQADTALTHQQQTTNNSSPTALYALSDRGSGTAASGARVTALKVWTGVLTEAQLYAESLQREVASTAGLWSYLSCRLGTTIGTDESGGAHNWTVTGSGLSLNTDEPIFRSGGTVLRTQQRARGFPTRAPLPGIARLGVGVLAVTSPAAQGGIDGSGSAALSQFASDASGLETFAGTADAALSPFAADASGLVTFTGTGSAAVSPFAASAAGVFAIPAPFAQPQPHARLYYPSKLPAPPIPQLGRGILVAGAQAFQGFGEAALSPFAVTASGAITFTGTGSAALSPFAATASGTEEFTGTGSAAISPFACTSSGAETFTGTGSAACSPFAVSADGVAGDAIGGSATAAMASFAADASGLETFTGSASAACSPFAVSCAGAETFTGSASAACQPFAVTGNGALGDSFFGSATAALSPFATTSTGGETFSGSGSAACAPFASDAAGAQTFTGSGSAALSPFACSGSGLHILPITGTGAAALASFACSATGVNASPVTGSGSAAMSPFACTAIGSDNIPTGPFVVSGAITRGGLLVRVSDEITNE